MGADKNFGIFVSYRRADTAGHAGRLADQLKSQFGDQVFLDVDSIKPGANFRDVIKETLDKCGAVIVLVGKRWRERDETAPPFGDPSDVITQEIQMSLDLKIPLVPVLVDGASMPSESELPSQLKIFSSLNAIDLRHASFDRDLEALSENLVEIFGGAKATRIEKFLLRIYGPFVGKSFGRIYGAIVLFSVFGMLWGLIELAAAAVGVSQHGLRSLMSASLMDAEMLRLQAAWAAALSGVLAGFFGRRSIRWWRHSTISMWISLAEIIVASLLAFVYVVQVPNATITELFQSKTPPTTSP